jgi:hypothetical protein
MEGAFCDASKDQKNALKEVYYSAEEVQQDDVKFRFLIERNIRYYLSVGISTASKCRIFYKTHQKSWQHNDIISCFEYAPAETIPELTNRLLQRRSVLAQNTLDTVLKTIAEFFATSKYSTTVKQLINSGASAEKVSLQHITNGHDIMCEATVLILKSNKHLYQHESSLNTRVDGVFRKEDLIYQSDTDNGRAMCPEAIRLLISYNPELRNVQSERGILPGLVPLGLYLLDKKHPDWDVEIAKSLITKKNINMQSNRIRATPLHSLLYHHYNESSYDLEIIVVALKLGADIDLKDKEGITVRDLIKKRADLVSLLVQ